ncbi:bifunctional adenosylcobinamide kinase/adenosylcobinamide-phosphate guanylyltransferase [Blastochloris viridis]|uniref:Bifunctional adenosylcobalamin biosynthesis protein n=1 Tax=Blastochloris viridis TaxID=1079 RepID=A0A0H5BGR4_BLAVI|nr:bifunctional adenosylcobinamide kinase/adenosylcobinamide-phosphate guanylyltransferase [Blastochloris viridis]ALK09762.1 Bifunctional adenosylcobalamin biosynthesis protein CobU [Blastochloris viridis]BAS00340.1 adenosylcobinamide-phosphate guanylyltransferase [Blastochloris viridis]CUU42425.1 Adenosylcobinamide kinase [Blastochloris viridis]
MGHLTFLTGPTRSGKSRRAVEIAGGWGDDVAFVATYPVDPGDAEMVERVRRHQAERPPSWRTLEAPERVADALCALDPAPAGALIDSVVLWTATRFERPDAEIVAAWEAELAGLKAAPFPSVLVGDEIGWSPVPMDASLRRFRDLVGILGQRAAAAADEAWLIVAGCPVKLK